MALGKNRDLLEVGRKQGDKALFIFGQLVEGLASANDTLRAAEQDANSKVAHHQAEVDRHRVRAEQAAAQADQNDIVIAPVLDITN